MGLVVGCLVYPKLSQGDWKNWVDCRKDEGSVVTACRRSRGPVSKKISGPGRVSLQGKKRTWKRKEGQGK